MEAGFSRTSAAPSLNEGIVIDFSDAMIFAMVFPNMLGLMLLFPKVKQELRLYLEACRTSDASQQGDE